MERRHLLVLALGITVISLTSVARAEAASMRIDRQARAQTSVGPNSLLARSGHSYGESTAENFGPVLISADDAPVNTFGVAFDPSKTTEISNAAPAAEPSSTASVSRLAASGISSIAGAGPAASPLALVFAALVFAALVVAGFVVMLVRHRGLPATFRPLVRPSSGTAVIGWGTVLAISVLPFLFDEVTVFNAGLVLTFVVAALGLHLLVNWAGQLSLAHAGMFGLPALVVLQLSEVHHVSPLYLVPVGVLVGAGTGVLVSLPAIRAQGLQIALVTLTASVAINGFFFRQEWLIGKSGGRAAAVPSLGPFEFNSSKDLYPVLLVVVAITLLFFWVLMHSKVGRAWLWLAADPDAASAFGIPIAKYKIAAYGAAGAFAGLGGALMAAWVRHLSPQAFPPALSFTFLLVAVLAGRGFAGGVLLSGLMLRGGPLFFSASSSGVNRMLLYLGPIAMLINLTSYKAGFNGAGRSLVNRLSRSTSGLGGGSDRQGPQGTEQTEARMGVESEVHEDGDLAEQSISDASRPIELAFIASIVAGTAGLVSIGLDKELLAVGFGGLALVILATGMLLRHRLQLRGAVVIQHLARLSGALVNATQVPTAVAGTEAGDNGSRIHRRRRLDARSSGVARRSR